MHEHSSPASKKLKMDNGAAASSDNGATNNAGSAADVDESLYSRQVRRNRPVLPFNAASLA